MTVWLESPRSLPDRHKPKSALQGRLLMELKRSNRTETDFWQLVAVGGPDDCWEWTGGMNGGGYGTFRRNPVGERFAHRLAFRLSTGEIPAGHCVMHSCDNPPCCNPKHLSTGTKAENSAQMVARGRSTSGESHGKAILTEPDVANIRSRDGESQRVLAEEFGVTKSAISSIMNGSSWRCSYDGTLPKVDRTPRGERSGMTRFTQEDVDDIRSRGGQSQKSIAEEFCVSRPTISLIMRGITWKEGYVEPKNPRHPKARGSGNGNSKLTESQVSDIRSRSGQSQQSIADEFGVAQTTISSILSRKVWGHIN